MEHFNSTQRDYSTNWHKHNEKLQKGGTTTTIRTAAAPTRTWTWFTHAGGRWYTEKEPLSLAFFLSLL